MKENYEALKMEVINFNGEIWTATASVTERDDTIVVSGDDRTPADGRGPFATVG